MSPFCLSLGPLDGWLEGVRVFSRSSLTEYQRLTTLLGRNWEGFAADPYASGVGMREVTAGLQSQGVQAQPKHWLLNEEEYRRNPGPQGEALSSNVDDRKYIMYLSVRPSGYPG